MYHSIYEPIKCSCGGTIANWKYPHNYTCDKCHREYSLHKLDYEILVPNKMTGWVFPTKIKGECC